MSDEPGHNASTVYAILKKLIPEIKIIIPDLKMVHYWTDSPTSQYRNKSIFNIVCNHEKWLEGGAAAWNYFEAGHGKGPCDGIGGTAKDLPMMQSSKRRSSYKTHKISSHGQTKPRAVVR